MAMFAVGLDGSVSFWNSAAERVLGWRSEEVLGNHMPNLIAHSPGGLFDGGPIKLVRKDGAEIQGPVQSVPVRDSRGAVSGILTIVTPGPV
jgi:PAS domain-containing protein